jgi:alkylated DNA nucleotide flippase Atl1
MYKPKTWREKMADKPSLPKVLKLKKKFPCYNMMAKTGCRAGDKVILVNPREVEAIMKSVPKGKLITIYEICRKIAKKNKVKGSCSLTNGIFVMQAAHAAVETKSKLPWWRTLKAKGFLNEKYPDAYNLQIKLLKKEGHNITKRGKKYSVLNFEKNLVK